MEIVALLLAVLAAASNALSSVLQRRANREEASVETHFGIRLLAAVIQRPSWLLGLLAMMASFLLQAVALGIGTLSSVEPVLAIELPLTLVIANRVLRLGLPRRDWISATAMAAGLALFVAALSPSGGDAGKVRFPTVLFALGGTGALIAAALLAGVGGPVRLRTAAFGVAAGSGFGLTASLMKVAVSHLEEGGLPGLFTVWETYAVIVTGVLSVVMVQAALHSGPLVEAQPGFTLTDPLVSVGWGVTVLGERTRGGIALLFAAIGAAIVLVAVLVLARSAALDSVPADASPPTAAPST